MCCSSFVVVASARLPSFFLSPAARYARVITIVPLATSRQACRPPLQPAGPDHPFLQHRHLASAPSAASASCWPRPPPLAAPAPGQRAAGGRRELPATSTTTCSASTWPARRPAPERDRGSSATTTSAPEAGVTECLFNISGGAGKNLTFLTGLSESAGAPLFMRVSGVSENLTFS